MTDDFCRAVRQAMPDIAQSVVTAMEDDLADCRTRLAEVEAENGRLRGALKPLACIGRDSLPDHGVYGPVKVEWIAAARAALAQTKEPSDDDG